MKYDIELPWAEFRDQVLGQPGWTLNYFDLSNHYWLYAVKNSFIAFCKIHQDSGADQTEFEADYKPAENPLIVNATQGRFERDDIVLKLACTSGQADASGDLALSILVPGTPGSEYRYAAGGYAFSDNYGWSDKIKKVEIVDEDNLLGLGAGTVVKVYHDSDADEANQGWFFWKTHGSEGECEIEPMGWYGQIPSGLYLRVTFKLQANANCKTNIWWGRTEA